MNVLQITPNLPDGFSVPSGTDTVQFCKQLSRADYEALSRELRNRPEVRLRIYHSGKTEFTNLDVLSFFPNIRKLSIELFWLENIDGFKAINDLDELTFGWTKKKSYSLRFLEQFTSIRKLYLEGHKKDIEAITNLRKVQRLTMRSITLPGVGFLADLPHLRHLEIKLGGTTNLRGLSALEGLTYLELWLIKGLSDVSVIANLRSLESLFLQALRNVTQLPSFKELKRLRWVSLETMKGLTDLRPVADAPVLEELSLVDMPTIDPKTLRCFIGHPALKKFHAGLGSLKRNAYAEALLGLPPSVWLPPGAREKAEPQIMTDAAKRAVN